MKVVDTNVLINAVNKLSTEHSAARTWLDGALTETEAVGFPWVVLTGFTRVVTHPRVFNDPMPVDQALDRVDAWLGAEPATIVSPTPRHFAIWGGLLRQVGTAGNLTTDAHVAALALEHGAQVVTFDRDFGRFDVSYLIPR